MVGHHKRLGKEWAKSLQQYTENVVIIIIIIVVSIILCMLLESSIIASS